MNSDWFMLFVTCFFKRMYKKSRTIKIEFIFQDECHFILCVRNGGQVVKMEINHVSLSFHSR